MSEDRQTWLLISSSILPSFLSSQWHSGTVVITETVGREFPSYNISFQAEGIFLCVLFTDMGLHRQQPQRLQQINHNVYFSCHTIKLPGIQLPVLSVSNTLSYRETSSADNVSKCQRLSDNERFITVWCTPKEIVLHDNNSFCLPCAALGRWLDNGWK